MVSSPKKSISIIVFAVLFFTGDRTVHLPSLVFFAMWQVHYVHRALIYPLRAHNRDKKMPISILGMGVLFNLINAAINGYWLFHIGPLFDNGWLLDARFLLGAVVFGVGMVININSDYRLVALRRENGSEYKIPAGGLFRWISCPNYLGEIIEWCGWALATWSLAGVSFAAWTFSNLAPRALSHHRWYRETFADYPKRRRALIPFLF